MATVSEELDPLLTEYTDRAAKWKVDHDRAERCGNLEDILVLGIAIHFSIDLIDTNWRMAVFGGKSDYDTAEEQVIVDHYRRWLQPADHILARIAETERVGYQVKWAEQFRRVCREAKAIFTADSEFFSGDALTKQRDAAIDAHQEGRTVEFHEFGD